MRGEHEAEKLLGGVGDADGDVFPVANVGAEGREVDGATVEGREARREEKSAVSGLLKAENNQNCRSV